MFVDVCSVTKRYRLTYLAGRADMLFVFLYAGSSSGASWAGGHSGKNEAENLLAGVSASLLYKEQAVL
ncbi:MAG TPA: hypothetical protein VH593_15175 [Ktedonobacteraceae bacterium]